MSTMKKKIQKLVQKIHEICKICGDPVFNDTILKSFSCGHVCHHACFDQLLAMYVYLCVCVNGVRVCVIARFLRRKSVFIFWRDWQLIMQLMRACCHACCACPSFLNSKCVKMLRDREQMRLADGFSLFYVLTLSILVFYVFQFTLEISHREQKLKNVLYMKTQFIAFEHD